MIRPAVCAAAVAAVVLVNVLLAALVRLAGVTPEGTALALANLGLLWAAWLTVPARGGR